MKNACVQKSSIYISLIVSCFFAATTYAAPHWGTKTELQQPNGSTVDALMFGDEFFGWYESPDGYVIVKDQKSGWFCYANLSSDHTFISTSIRYRGEKAEAGSLLLQSLDDLKIKKKMKPRSVDILKLHEQKQKELNTAPNGGLINPTNENGIPLMMKSLSSPDDIHQPRIGAYVGITLLVDFSDDPATMPVAEINDFLNLPTGYNHFGNNGSIRQYFHDVSGGQLDYTNTLPPFYYRAAHAKTYYTDPTIPYGTRARELINEALNYVETNGFDFSTLSHDASNTIYAINCLYAGGTGGGWSQGLWPHSWSLYPVFYADGVHSGSYQISNIGTSLSIGTFCHENGHMLLYYPDLYDYGYQSYGAGAYCLMAYGGGLNPVPPNPYFRDYSGWETIIDATFMTNDVLVSQPSNSLTAYRYLNTQATPANEYFLVEPIQSTAGSRYATLIDDGLAIWHIERTGSNNNEQMTCPLHYLVSLEQADGNFDLENYNNIQDGNDLFKASGNHEFSDATTPNAQWWCNTIDGNTLSNLRLYDISAPGSVMSYRIRGATDLVVSHPATINASPLAQTITIVTGYSNQVVNLNGTGISQSLVTSGSGLVTFSVIDNTVNDMIWVTVTGGGFRYRGFIRVIASIPNDVALVMGFEDPSLWRFINGSGSLIMVPSPKTEGSASIQITGNGWQQIRSNNLNTTQITESGHLMMDVFVGNTQPNPYWVGQMQMYIYCPSAGVYNQYIGMVDLTGLPRNAFSTVTFTVPGNIVNALAGNHNDFSFSIALNTTAGSGPYYFDNMRF